MLESHDTRRLSSATPDGLPWTRILLVGAMIVVLVGTGAFFYVKSKEVSTDPLTLCPRSRPPTEVTVVLLDASDEFSEPQRLEVRNLLQRLRDEIPQFGLVEVYPVDRLGKRLTEPLIHLCNPGNGKEVNPIYQNPEFAQRKWQRFADTLSKAIDEQISASDALTSPIFEAIQATAIRTFDRPEFDGIPKRLVIISDLLQNVPGELSMYDAVPSFSAFRRTPYFSRIRSDLTGVSVIVYYLVRSNVRVQGRAHIAFWDDYFRAQGAALEEVTSVFGDR